MDFICSDMALFSRSQAQDTYILQGHLSLLQRKFAKYFQIIQEMKNLEYHDNRVIIVIKSIGFSLKNNGIVTLCVSGIPIETEIQVTDQICQVQKVDDEISIAASEPNTIQMIWKRGDGYPDEAVQQQLHLQYVDEEQDGDIALRTIRFAG